MGQVSSPQSNFTATSETAAAIGSGATLVIAGLGVVRVAPAAAVTGIIIPPGEFAGQRLTVLNESPAADSVTFDVAATSNVANGVTCVIPGLTARQFTWNGATGFWYPED